MFARYANIINLMHSCWDAYDYRWERATPQALVLSFLFLITLGMTGTVFMFPSNVDVLFNPASPTSEVQSPVSC